VASVVRREWWDGFSADDIKYSKTSNRVHIILLFHGGASRAFEASHASLHPSRESTDPFFVRTNRKYLSPRGSTKSVSNVALHVSRFCTDFLSFHFHSHSFILTLVWKHGTSTQIQITFDIKDKQKYKKIDKSRCVRKIQFYINFMARILVTDNDILSL